jgi:hypothetical protein
MAGELPAALGDLVVTPQAGDLGVGRLERVVQTGDGPLFRIFFYGSGRFGVFGPHEVKKAPPGVWPPADPAL